MKIALIVFLSIFTITARSQSGSGTIQVHKVNDTVISGRLIISDFWIEPKIKMSFLDRKGKKEGAIDREFERSGRISKLMVRGYPSSIHLRSDATCMVYFSDMREAIAYWSFDGDTLKVKNQAKASSRPTLKLNRIGSFDEFVMSGTYDDRPARVTYDLINEEDPGSMMPKR